MMKRYSSHLVFSILALAFGITAAMAQAGHLPERPTFGSALAPGDPAPSIVAYDLSGQNVYVNWGAKAFTLVSFWTPKCVPCRGVMETFQSLLDRRGKGGLAVYGLVIGNDVKPVEEARDGLGLRYPILISYRRLLLSWGAVGLVPTTFLVNREGKIVRRYVGATKNQLEGLAADVDAVFDGRPLGRLVEPDEAPAVETP